MKHNYSWSKSWSEYYDRATGSVGVTIKAVQSDDKIQVSVTWRESVLNMKLSRRGHLILLATDYVPEVEETK